MKKVLFLCLICLLTMSACQQSTPEYVDLGLPSGTLWKFQNERSMYYTYDEAINEFGDKLPTREQYAELLTYCTWEWTEDERGCIVKGKNGNTVYFPAAGFRETNGDIMFINRSGRYWSSTSNTESVWHLRFENLGLNSYWQESISKYDRSLWGQNGLSVRLVKINQ